MRTVIRAAVILAAVLCMVLPIPAQAQETNHGTRDWNYTVYQGPHQFVFNRAAAIRVTEPVGWGDWWGRVALKCTRNGQPTNCNMDVDNMTVYEQCGPPDNDWGPRDFTTVTSTWYHPFDGVPRTMRNGGSCWYRVEAEARVRFLDINVLTPWLDVCSDWVVPSIDDRFWTACDV
jgi:hypothetical protein